MERNRTDVNCTENGNRVYPAVIVILPARCFVGREGLNLRVNVLCDLENEILTWSCERCAAGTTFSAGAPSLPEDAFVFKLQPCCVKEAKIIRRLFYRLAIRLGLIGIDYLNVNADGSAVSEPFVRRREPVTA